MKTAAKNGMTLIEVLLAMLILGMSIGALMTNASRCLSVIRKSRQYETARQLIQRIELEYPLDDEDIFRSETAGNFDEYEEYRWERGIVAIDEETRPGLFQITTRVYWSDRNRDIYEELTTLRYLPDQGGLK
ncbi:prepilin-type N-terminal cleavage/methylation domain-containing protein [Verrucomicrobiota bacterium]